MAMHVFDCVHVWGAGHVCGVGVHMGRKLAMRELWTGEPTSSKTKLTRERQMHDQESKKTTNRLMTFVGLIFLHLPSRG
jgi:hypothetical protein